MTTALVDGPACSIDIMQIATSGQSRQSFFCLSGQHDMSMPAICIMALDALFPAATGDASGATANPTVTSTANKSRRNRDASMGAHIPTTARSEKALAFTSLRGEEVTRVSIES
jgi:hypothetical protein